VSKLTKEQIEAAIKAMSSWHPACDKKESLMYVLAPHLQYAPEPVDGDLVERMRREYDRTYRDALAQARSTVTPYLAFAAMTAAARVCIEAALGPVTDEEKVQMRRDFHSIAIRDGSSGWDAYYFALDSLLAYRPSRLLRKEPEERVTVEEVHTTPLNYSPNCAFTVMLDKKPAGPLHSTREYAEIYADGLRFRLQKEESK
jgi:hypothetical protein